MSKNRAEVDSVAVKPSLRGRGRRSRFDGARLRRLLRRSGDLPPRKLTVRLNNVAAIALYPKARVARERRAINGYYEDGAPAWRVKNAVVTAEAGRFPDAGRLQFTCVRV